MNEAMKKGSNIAPAGDTEAKTASPARNGPETPRPLANVQSSAALLSSPALVVSLATAAKMLDSCKRTVERERDRGELKCLRIGGRWKVRVGELHAYLRRKEIEQGRG